ncbi:hypothetical protein JR316_0011956 [Psilocybe cubensis]|uniref:Uncharacterized protein n=1 Tax=Psilocybe cubensis TaxID=181762 RepID=A0ACB8GME9_PSICU|nr:hypothetical protein JR316_0011956 [Psilocybe cubensis]KAH9476381.1 hypothetical protein JR316_0011956 [Psilocybe cubensis]
MSPIIFWVALPQGLEEVPLGFCVALPSILSTRLILAIRKMAVGKEGYGWSEGDMTTFEVRRDLTVTTFDVGSASVSGSASASAYVPASSSLGDGCGSGCGSGGELTPTARGDKYTDV